MNENPEMKPLEIINDEGGINALSNDTDGNANALHKINDPNPDLTIQTDELTDKESSESEQPEIMNTSIAETENTLLTSNESENIVVEPIVSDEIQVELEINKFEGNEAEDQNIVAKITPIEILSDNNNNNNNNNNDDVTVQQEEVAEKTAKESSELLNEHDIIAEEEEHEIEPNPSIQYSSLSKIELIEKLEELVKTDQISKIKTDVTAIKVAYFNKSKEEKQVHLDTYLANGGTKEEYIPDTDLLEDRFKNAFDIYKEIKTRDDQEQEKIKLQNLELKKQILNEIKQLIDSEDSLKKTYDDFKALQDKWKQIGMVPRNEIEGLWNNYHFQVEKFFEKVKINKELKDLDLKKNLEAKIILCEKAEELLFEKSITTSFKLLQKYHNEWKEIGPVIQDKKDEIWERFKNVSDNINQQRKEYYESLHKEQESNLMAKTALCEKVKEINSIEIANSNDWNKRTEEIFELQKLWDSIGRASVKFNDVTWERFKTGVNAFFNNKKEFFGEVKDQQFNNYNLKLDICAQAEGLVESTNWKQATNEILKLQQDWKKVGPVPLRYSDKVWKRFRSACDKFFAKKAEFFSNIQGVEQENQKKKEDLIERVNLYEVNPEKSENLANLKNFQREWVEIGFVPMDVKEKLQNEFKKAISALMDKLKISSSEVNTMHYKNRIENIQSSPNSKDNLYKERIFIEGKLSKLKSEILQWENNLGFFASSKKADLLKEEFEKKIQGAKQEAALLEAKLKLLRNNQ